MTTPIARRGVSAVSTGPKRLVATTGGTTMEAPTRATGGTMRVSAVPGKRRWVTCVLNYDFDPTLRRATGDSEEK